jgi:hypothetical protein
MAMNRQRRTANINNVLTYDSVGNSTLIANLTVEGLTGAGFVKADVNGLLSVDTTVITGTALSGQVAYFTGASTQAGSNNLFWDNNNARLGIGTNTPQSNIQISENKNGITNLQISNTTAGTASQAGLRLDSDASSGTMNIGKYSSTSNTYLSILARDGYLSNANFGDITLQNEVATGRIKFAAGAASTPQMTLFSSGNLGIGGGLTDTTQRLQVTGTALITGATTFNSNVSVGGTHRIINSNFLRLTKFAIDSTSYGDIAFIDSLLISSINGSIKLGSGNPASFTEYLGIANGGAATFSNTLTVSSGFTVNSGNITLTSLSGSGTRIVVVSPTGVLSTQPTSTYLTSLTGEATNSGSLVTLTNSAVIGKVLTGVNISSGVITASDSVLSAFGKLQGQINGLQGGTIYRGAWNASTNTPTITSSVGTLGNYYVVTTAGTTNINGISSWAVGDWIIFNGTIWEKIPNVDSITSVNGQTGAVVLTTASITESGNLYYTDTRARAAISLTTSGSSGVATYSSGVLNIPNYTLSGLGGASSATLLTINGTSFDLTSSRSWSVGTVTSVNASVPTGFAVGAAVTSSGNIAISFADGYSLPLIASQTNWDAAYNDKINSAAVTGTTTKTLTLTQQDGGTVTANWTDINTDAVTSVFGRTGAVVAASGDYNTLQVTENTNLYYTEARVNANANVAANTAARHNAVTLGTQNGLSLNSQVLSLGLASTSANGALSSTDWNLFNNKQNALTNPVTGTGTNNYIVKFTGPSTVANSIIAESAGLVTVYGGLQAYSGQAGGGLTNIFITNDDTSFGNRHETKISTQALGSGLGRTIIQAASYNTSTNRGELAILTESGANYVANIGTILTGANNAFSLYSIGFVENIRLNTGGDSFMMGGNVGIGINLPTEKLHVSGNAIVTGTLTANSIIKSEGTASQILAANGSVITAGTNITISGGTISATGVGGSGTTNYIPKFTAAGTIGNSIMYNDSANNRIGINIITPDSTLHITGTFKVDTILGLEQIQTVIQTDTNCNFYVNATQVGANALGTLSMGVGTAPTSSPGNVFQMYSADIVNNNAAPHFRTENGAVIKLYQETTSVGNSIFSAGGGSAVLNDSTFDGYTLRQIVKALRNLGILQ